MQRLGYRAPADEPEPDQLVEEHRRHSRGREYGCGHERITDVAERDRAARAGILDRRHGGVPLQLL
jgi:hypothetical protein